MLQLRHGIKGFTLVELLVVLAVLGILAAIAIPQYADYRQKTYDSASLADMQNLRTNLELYFSEKQKFP
jgi:type IV pilus assembly protein PilA